MKKHTQRGSIEVVVLVVVVAVIVGLVAWRIAETQKSQLDTQAAIDNAPPPPPPAQMVEVEPLGVSFTVPNGRGGVTYGQAKGGDAPSVPLVSETLKNAKYTCEGKNLGMFGTLGVVAADNGPQPQYTKKLGGKTYGFTNGLTRNCYNAELIEAFRGNVPKAIITNLELVNKDGTEPSRAD